MFVPPVDAFFSGRLVPPLPSALPVEPWALTSTGHLLSVLGNSLPKTDAAVITTWPVILSPPPAILNGTTPAILAFYATFTATDLSDSPDFATVFVNLANESQDVDASELFGPGDLTVRLRNLAIIASVGLSDPIYESKQINSTTTTISYSAAESKKIHLPSFSVVSVTSDTKSLSKSNVDNGLPN